MKRHQLLIIIFILISNAYYCQSLFDNNTLDSLVNKVNYKSLSYDTSAITVRAYLSDHFDNDTQKIKIDTNFRICAVIILNKSILKFFVLKYDIILVDSLHNHTRKFTIICNEINTDFVNYFKSFNEYQLRHLFYIENLYLRDENNMYIKLKGLRPFIR